VVACGCYNEWGSRWLQWVANRSLLNWVDVPSDSDQWAPTRESKSELTEHELTNLNRWSTRDGDLVPTLRDGLELVSSTDSSMTLAPWPQLLPSSFGTSSEFWWFGWDFVKWIFNRLEWFLLDFSNRVGFLLWNLNWLLCWWVLPDVLITK
jgi:hypothetical protein